MALKRYDLITFADAVRDGLTATPGHMAIDSYWLYDWKGSEIFKEICEVPEYYLTVLEKEILQKHSEKISQNIGKERGLLKVVEFGAGDGTKAEILLHSLPFQKNIVYYPIDISATALEAAVYTVKRSSPNLLVTPIQGHFDQAFDRLEGIYAQSTMLYLYLGSSIGNFVWKEAVEFCKKVASVAKHGDFFLVGFDLKKDPKVLQAAYDDPGGVTARFNFNLLERINRELDGNFDIAKWYHHAYYDSRSGAMCSSLIARERQYAVIAKVRDEPFEFAAWDAIHTERSGKYLEQDIVQLAMESGFSVVKHFKDPMNWFVDSLWRKSY